MNHYTINVSRNGKHVFATADHSLRDFKQAQQLARDFLTRFPASEGFKVELRGVQIITARLSFDHLED